MGTASREQMTSPNIIANVDGCFWDGNKEKPLTAAVARSFLMDVCSSCRSPSPKAGLSEPRKREVPCGAHGTTRESGGCAALASAFNVRAQKWHYAAPRPIYKNKTRETRRHRRAPAAVLALPAQGAGVQRHACPAVPSLQLNSLPWACVTCVASLAVSARERCQKEHTGEGSYFFLLGELN